MKIGDKEVSELETETEIGDFDNGYNIGDECDTPRETELMNEENVNYDDIVLNNVKNKTENCTLENMNNNDEKTENKKNVKNETEKIENIKRKNSSVHFDLIEDSIT